MIKDELAHWSSEGWETVTDNCSDECKKLRMRYVREMKYRKMFDDSKHNGQMVIIDRNDVSGILAGQKLLSDNLQYLGRKSQNEETINNKIIDLDIPNSRYKQDNFAKQLDTNYHCETEIQSLIDKLFSKDCPPAWIDTMKYIIIDGGSRQTRSLMVSSILYRIMMYNVNRLSPGSQSVWNALRKDFVEFLTNIEEDRKTFVDFNKIDTENSVISTPVFCLQEVKDTILLTPAVVDVMDSVLSRRIDKIGGGINIVSLSNNISRNINYGNVMGQILKTDKVVNNPTTVCMRIKLKPAKDMLETKQEEGI